MKVRIVDAGSVDVVAEVLFEKRVVLLVNEGENF